MMSLCIDRPLAHQWHYTYQQGAVEVYGVYFSGPFRAIDHMHDTITGKQQPIALNGCQLTKMNIRNGLFRV
ncbi:hypothetical protein [Chitinophaga sancti]|uniref:hypothetical protein n=1 Tax=Chitinophaga sancti TaxID=1004 RepID=UPI003F79B19C